MKLPAHNLFNPHTACLTEQAMFDYIDEKLSPQECHEVEKHMLDCAFCSDAMEGLELLKDRSKIQGLPLKEEKPDTGGGIILPFNTNIRLAAAAILVILTGSWIFFGYILKEEKAVVLAEKETPVSAKPPEALVTVSDEQTFYRYYEPVPVSRARQEITKTKTSATPDALYPDKKEPEVSAPKDENANAPAGSGITQSAIPAPVAAPPAGQAEDKKQMAAGAPAAVQQNSNMGLARADEVTTSSYHTEIMSAKKQSRTAKRNKERSVAANSPEATNAAKSQDAKSAMQTDQDVAADRVSPVKENAPAGKQPSAAGAMAKTAPDSAPALSAKPVLLPVVADRLKQAPKSKADSVLIKKAAASVSFKNTDAVNAYLEQGLTAYDRKSYALAIGLFGKVLAAEPHNETALLFKGFSALSIEPADNLTAIVAFDALLHSKIKAYRDEAAWFKALALVRESRREEARVLLTGLSATPNAYSQRAAELLKELNKKDKK